MNPDQRRNQNSSDHSQRTSQHSRQSLGQTKPSRQVNPAPDNRTGESQANDDPGSAPESGDKEP